MLRFILTVLTSLLCAQAAFAQHGANVWFPPTDSQPLQIGVQATVPRILKATAGGKASKLVNGKDAATGWPMLSNLDITGQVTVDIPCTIERCRITVTGLKQGRYAVNSPDVAARPTIRFCELSCPLADDGTVCSAVVNNVKLMHDTVISGGGDGVQLTNGIIEDCLIYGQIPTTDSHNDAVEITRGKDIIIRRCRIEGPRRNQTSAIIVGATFGDVENLLIEDCYLSGGTYTLYTRLKPPKAFTITGLKIRGCIWDSKSFVYGPYSTDVVPAEWSNNFTATVAAGDVHSPIVMQSKVAYSLKGK